MYKTIGFELTTYTHIHTHTHTHIHTYTHIHIDPPTHTHTPTHKHKGPEKFIKDRKICDVSMYNMGTWYCNNQQKNIHCVIDRCTNKATLLLYMSVRPYFFISVK